MGILFQQHLLRQITVLFTHEIMTFQWVVLVDIGHGIGFTQTRTAGTFAGSMMIMRWFTATGTGGRRSYGHIIIIPARMYACEIEIKITIAWIKAKCPWVFIICKMNLKFCFAASRALDTHLNRPQQDRDLIMAANPRLYFLLKNAYSIGLMHELDEPSHWATGVTLFRTSLSSMEISPPIKVQVLLYVCMYVCIHLCESFNVFVCIS